MTRRNGATRHGIVGSRVDLSRRVLSPRTALLVLIASCNLFLVHAVLVFLLVQPPYSAAEGVLLWGSGFLGLVLLVYGTTVAWDTLGQLRDTEAKLSETRGRLHALIDASPLPITAGDHEGRITLWNQAAERVFGWKEREVLGRRYPAVPEPESAAWTEMRGRVLQGEVIMGVEGRRQTKDGGMLHVSVSAAPVRDRRGRIEGTMAVIADVTQKKEREQERFRLEEQLRQAQKMEAVGRLAGGIAHDFNNLLTAIKGHAELLIAGPVTEEQLRDDLEEIGRSADRAAALTRQLLAFSRQSMVEPRPVDLNTLVGGMERLLRRVVGETVALEMDLHPGLGTVLADPGQMEQVLMNLVVNARDAMPGGGRLVIRTSDAVITEAEASAYSYRVVPGEYVLLTVSDTGSGMDPATAAQIFEPFFTTKPVGVGTGLGLSTVYGIIKQARGYIWVDTDLGVGTTFMVYLPRSNREADTVAPRRRVAAPSADGTETVLVAEDEEAVLGLARKVLERRGYHVLTASRGQEAVRIAREYAADIHILFCDAVMPDLTGGEVIERVKELRPGIRVLMTSGYAEQMIAHQGVAENGEAFLAKPYTPAELSCRVREVLAET
ncbi:MAG: PAS domain S-box protein [Gemmatimonadetes bacterium]|nr:PAS domain S-box protein [Gemmatimonadota bacterium]